jgi:hypothetical protein
VYGNSEVSLAILLLLSRTLAWVLAENGRLTDCDRVMISSMQQMRVLGNNKVRKSFKELKKGLDENILKEWSSYVREWDLHHYTRY